jgi:hypothetical protein
MISVERAETLVAGKTNALKHIQGIGTLRHRYFKPAIL